MERDFTYIDDIIQGLEYVIENTAKSNNDWSGKNPDPSSSIVPYKIYNIGNNSPVNLMEFIKAIENATGKKAKMNMLPIQDGDIPASHADVSDLIKDFHYSPNTSTKEGISNFIEWYREYYKIL